MTGDELPVHAGPAGQRRRCRRARVAHEACPVSEFDDDTAVDPGGAPGRYLARLTERWGIGAGMNGGYLAAVGLRAVMAESSHPDPLSLSVHYMSRPTPGEAEVRVEALRVGRAHGFFRFDLVQDEARLSGLVTTGRLRGAGPLDFGPEAPAMPSPEASRPVRPGDDHASLWDRLESRVGSPDDVFFLRSAPGEARTGGWVRLADGRQPDALVVPLFLDCWPPAIFSRTMQADGAGAPTLELSVHWRAPVPPGWLLARLETRALGGGYADEHGELWTPSGRFVAESRQLARYTGGAGDFA